MGSRAGDEAVGACLAALERQRDGDEVIVCESEGSPPELRRRFGWASFIDAPGALVPELWREGIERSRGDVVALTNSTMIPADDWLETLRREHEERDVVAGAIEPGDGLRLADLAEYLCRYAPDMLPFEPHESVDLPGDNASYKRELLERTRETYRDGFWEPEVHRRLAEQGVRLWHSPRLVVRQGRSAGIRAFVRQRIAHGRAHGRQRGARFGPGRNLVGVLASPLVVPLLTARILARLRARGRLGGRVLLAVPLIALFNAAWAAGEARGHLDALRGG